VSACPSDLALQIFSHAPGDREAQGVEAHLPSCERCRSRIDALRLERRDFDAFVFPQTVDLVLDGAQARAGTRPKRWWAWSLPIFAAGAAAAAVLLTLHRPATIPGTQWKGSAISLGVLMQRGADFEPVVNGAHLPPGALLRFTFHTASECWLTVASVDASGAVSRFFPAEGDAERVHSGPLSGAAQLDASRGPERIFAICSEKAASFESLRRAIVAEGVHEPEQVRSLRQLTRLPAGTSQTTILVEKGE
jgi:hypothetical protein